jgi:hypothetical protein
MWAMLFATRSTIPDQEGSTPFSLNAHSAWWPPLSNQHAQWGGYAQISDQITSTWTSEWSRQSGKWGASKWGTCGWGASRGQT